MFYLIHNVFTHLFVGVASDHSSAECLPLSPSHAAASPSVRVIRPTLRSRPPNYQGGTASKTMRSASSMDDLFQEGEGEGEVHGRNSPVSRRSSASSTRAVAATGVASVTSNLGGGRPPSRTGMKRPSSRTGVRPSSRSAMRDDYHKTSGTVGNGKMSGKVRGHVSKSAQPSPSHR